MTVPDTKNSKSINDTCPPPQKSVEDMCPSKVLVQFRQKIMVHSNSICSIYLRNNATARAVAPMICPNICPKTVSVFHLPLNLQGGR